MTPKFAVGEVVILQSMKSPELNGEYTIRHVHTTVGEWVKDRAHPLGVVRRMGKGIGYLFEEILPYSTTLGGDPSEVMWAESALRKKHQPGELSFDKLMSSLSQPVQEPSHS